MQELVIDWLAGHWLEFVSLAIAAVALFYAALAHNLSRNTVATARSAELVSLRIQAISCIAEAEHCFLALQSKCQENRENWRQYEHKHMPQFGRRSIDELSDAGQVEREGRALLSDLRQHFVEIGEMNTAQLEQGFQTAKAAAFKIKGLAGTLKSPAKLF